MKQDWIAKQCVEVIALFLHSNTNARVSSLPTVPNPKMAPKRRKVGCAGDDLAAFLNADVHNDIPDPISDASQSASSSSDGDSDDEDLFQIRSSEGHYPVARGKIPPPCQI